MQVLMSLGKYKFYIGKNSFDSLNKKSSYRWSEIEKIGNKNSLQFGGIDCPTITLDCNLFAKLNGKSPVLLVEQMEKEASKGLPMILIDSNGKNFGRWVITSISSNQSYYNKWSVPEKAAVSIELKGYDRW